MKNSKTLFQEIVQSITLDESREEIESIAHLLLSDVFGIDRTATTAGTPIPWELNNELTLRDAIERINQHEPVQYIIGSAMFMGRKFLVDHTVLIPRPETEELVLELLRYVQRTPSMEGWRILDIGTGSGCIPVTCAAEIPASTVMATDVSEHALGVARSNVIQHKVQVQLLLHDVLSQPLPFRNLDLIISNPPYIPWQEKDTLDRNVVMFEPHQALFVKHENPLLFYEAISAQAKLVLKPGGVIFFESHEKYADAVAGHLSDSGYVESEIHRDVAGKPRVVKAVLP